MRRARVRGLAAAALLLGILVAASGCAANSGASSDSDRNGTFYGGVSGGFTRP